MTQAPKRLDGMKTKLADSPGRPGLSNGQVTWMSIAAGVSVANVYYLQPLLRPLAASFAVSDALAGLLPMITMVGYAAGLLLVVPALERTGLHRLPFWLRFFRSCEVSAACAGRG